MDQRKYLIASLLKASYIFATAALFTVRLLFPFLKLMTSDEKQQPAKIYKKKTL